MFILQQAQYLINVFGSPLLGGGITPLKLQKLLYYIKAWGLVAKHPLVIEPFEKWDYGPVNREVYDYYALSPSAKQFGSQRLQPAETAYHPGPGDKKLIDFIGTCYSQFNALTLSAMTHREDPWLKTPSNEVISESLM